MRHDWKRRFTWVDLQEIESAFLKEPFPKRGLRGKLGNLRDSIREFGIINPIICRVELGKLQIICGYRRWLAAQVAGIERIPVIVTRLSDLEARRLFLEEYSGKWISEDNLLADDDCINEVDESSEAIGVQGEENDAVQDGSAVTASFAGDAGRGESWSSGGSPSASAHLDRARSRLEHLFATSVQVFEATRVNRVPPREDVEAIVRELVELSPIQVGYDVRDVGRGAEGFSDERGDVVSCVAAHSLRVAILALHFAESLAWSSRATEDLVLSGLLHDLGMLLVPEEDFHSKLPLNQNRQRVIHGHTSSAQEMIQKVRGWPKCVSIAARDHHERWDGTGYPAGRRGGEVELIARIVGILDSYAAMISVRAYRPSYLISEAIRILDESTEVGLFEPELERSFLKVFSAKPVGFWGRFPDGSLGRVRAVCRNNAKTHLVEVHKGGVSRRQGETLWVAEDELASQVTEVPAPSRESVLLDGVVSDAT